MGFKFIDKTNSWDIQALSFPNSKENITVCVREINKFYPKYLQQKDKYWIEENLLALYFSVVMTAFQQVLILYAGR